MAGICSIGGLTGFYLKGSKPSLFGGLAVGVMYGLTGYLLKENNIDAGLPMGIASSALLVFGMLPRAIKVQKPLPVAMVILGTLNAAFYTRKYMIAFN